jgi:DNA polymerase III epsilon subunit-like protein
MKKVTLKDSKGNEINDIMKDVLTFDCETTGLPPKGAKWDVDFAEFPNIVQLAWAVNEKERSFIIKPEGWEIPEASIEVHGITAERANAEGVPFADIIDEFLEDCEKARLLVGHNIYFDTSIVKAMILRIMGREYYDAKAEDALFKGKRIDTMMKTIKFVGALYSNGRPGKYPKLEELYSKLFPGETFPAHDALEDIRALRRCVPELVNLGIIELAQKEYPAEQLKAQFEPEKPKGGRNIEFHDPNPVTEPIGTGETAPEPILEPERPAVPSNSKTRELLDETEF